MRERIRVWTLAVLVILGWLPAALYAQSTVTLSGVVYGGNAPLADATVEALTNGTTNAVATSVTDGLGQYALAVSPGVYDVRVTPPAGSEFGQEVVQDVEVTADRQYDVVLLSSGGPKQSTISGTVRGYGGAAVPSVYVNIYSATNWQWLGGMASDANGAYSITVADTAVHVYVNGYGSAATPGYWYYRRYNLPLSGNLQQDIVLPVAQVSGVVTDSDGLAVQGASLQASGYVYDSQTQTESYSEAYASTNASGAYSMLLLNAQVSFTVRPPAGNTAPRINESVAVTGDVTRNFQFAPQLPRYVVSGVVRGFGGAALPNVYVNVVAAATGEYLVSTVTDANGAYSATVATNAVSIYVNGYSSASTPSYWYHRKYNLQLGGDLQYDIPLPIARLSGTVFDANDAAVAGASLQASMYLYDSATQTESYSENYATSADTGAYAMLMFNGNVNATVRPPAGNTAPRIDQSFTLNGDLVRDFKFAPELPRRIVSGTVRGLGGQGVPNVYVNAQSASTGEYLFSTSTDANGFFTGVVTASTIHLYVNGYGSPVTPSYWYARRYNVALDTGTNSIDVDLRVIRLNGNAADSNGSPVQGVAIQPYTYVYDSATQSESYSENYASSDAAGAYSLLLLPGSGNVSIRPSSSSGFSQVTLSNVSLTKNLTQRIVLQRPDGTPPVIVTRPVVVHLSDTSVSVSWTTDEPATSRVDFGLGSLTTTLSSSDLRTSHSVTLTDLLPTGVYSFRVSSTDRAGNGPTSSDIGYFTTQPPPGDITPPVILSGPAVVSASDSAAIIQWSTDEPANSVVEYGLTPGLGSRVESSAGTFVKSHSLSLNGLGANTTYYARVSATDPDGNGPTRSSIFPFTTAAAPDTQAPAISGLTIVAVTQSSITIAWTTSEAATSGVSYNDGSTWFVVNDPAYVIEHEVTLAGLAPQRTYSITVSSRDAAGNGPTLGGPIQATTLATADTTGPAVSSLVIDPSKTTASILWSTNEPASCIVRFGTVAGAPDSAAGAQGFASEHSATLTGLAPATTYYVTVVAVDVAGNVTTSAETSFTTLAGTVNLPPTAPGPFTVSSNPSRTGAFTLTWGASTDDGGPIASYEVFRNGQSVQLLAGDAVTSFVETGLPEGEYAYTVRATDGQGLTTDSSAFVVVVDQTAPSLTLPSAIETPATSATDAIVTYVATANDARDPAPVLSCKPSSGSVFTIGTTTVSCTATDAAGNVATGSFSVTVTDPFPPILTVPANMHVDGNSPNGTAVTFAASATDNSDPAPVVQCTPSSGSTFPVGTTTVSCTATDSSENSVTRTFTITVTGPAIVPSSVTLAFDPASPVFGQTVTFTAAVTTTGTPTGNVEFREGATLLGTTPLTGTVATFAISSLGVGPHAITATYAGDDTHESSTSTPVSVSVGKATPIVSAAGGTFVYDDQAHPATGSATGVRGEDLGDLLFTYNGSPAVPVNAGVYDVVATFPGDATYVSASAATRITITPAVTSAALSAAPGQAVAGQAVRFAVSIAVVEGGGTPDGSVSFYEGTTLLGTSAVTGGEASLTHTFPLGAHAVTATYTGSANFRSSDANGVTVTVVQADTATVLVSAPNPSAFGQPFTLKAGVAVQAPGSGSPSGSIEFFNGTSSLGVVPVSASGSSMTASLVLTSVPPGTHTFSARYSGDALFHPSASAVVTHVVESRANSTSTRVNTPQNPASASQPLSIEAVVDALTGNGQPTGTVQFFNGSNPLGAPVPLVLTKGAMRAQISVMLAAGTHMLSAKYSGDATFTASTSEILSQTMYTGSRPTTTVTSVSAPSRSLFGEQVTFTASVKPGGNVVVTGTVQFFIDGVEAGAPMELPASKSVTLVKSGLPRGKHTITAHYIPDVPTLASSSGQTTHIVQ